jgi:hypothetical protein
MKLSEKLQKRYDSSDRYCFVKTEHIDDAKTLERVVEVLARKLVDCTGTCPLDMHDWQHPDGCEKVCDAAGEAIDEAMAKCWILWAQGESV